MIQRDFHSASAATFDQQLSDSCDRSLFGQRYFRWLAVVFVLCSGPGNVISQEKEDTAKAPTYMENFRSLCNQLKPVATKINDQPFIDDFTKISAAVFESETVANLQIRKRQAPKTLLIGAKECSRRIQ